ncbi:MAG TPA: tetratricopeptide repeat protein [Paenalcaligenes sp.]|nr:tetratricopeptide repeat protein [Paenalcaligenes sp.]
MFQSYPHRHKSIFAALRNSSRARISLLVLSVVLCSLWSAGLTAQTNSEPVFPAADTRDEGWKPLANLLNALTPGADTSVPLSGSEINRRIYNLIQNGKADEALDAIERREKQLAESQILGTDVQLLFLKGRAFESLGQYQDAFELYKKMTTLYPELPEPWNNLALEYVRQGNLNLAEDSLAMALTADPGNETALQNLGEVRLMLAEETFQRAGPKGKPRAAEIQNLLR